ncbi:MAG: RHS repeat-associated core domain-containing protein, partial [Erysipelotrichaceae bacterium]|nr:RHS repeat-associated core domain-containing protein [Erysipelotrichaceae bacterium]
SLYYLQSRYYDPKIGRFISKDHLNYLDPKTIGGLNLYAYCAGNPVMYTDSSGTSPWTDFWNSTWGKVLGTILVVAAVVAISFATAGIGTAITAAMGGFWGAVVGGAVGGAISGAIMGAGISMVVQGISGGYSNIDYALVGWSALTGAITGAMMGGFVGGFRYIRAVKFLKANGVENIDEIMSSFKGTPRLKTIKAGTEVFRVHGGQAKAIGHWVSPHIYADPVQSLAINPIWGNSASEVSKIVLKENVKALVGIAARQGLFSGGGLQWYVVNLLAMSIMP